MTFDELYQTFIGEIDSLTTGLQNGEITPDEWYDEFANAITRFMLAAWMIGTGSSEVTPADMKVIEPLVQAQLNWLDNFYLVILAGLAAGEWVNGWNARARQYAGAIKQTWWGGKTRGLDLPGYPAVDTSCDGNCGCEWYIQTIDEAAGDYDAFWVRGKQDSCPTCLERERKWNPYQIRGNVGYGPTESELGE